MSDNKVCLKMKKINKYLFAFLLLCSLISCSNKKNDSTTKETKKDEQQIKQEKPKELIGKYIYIDANNVAHRSIGCHIIQGQIERYSRKVELGLNSSIQRVLTDTLNRNVLDSSCFYCIGDSIYEVLLDRIESRKLYEE